MRTLTADDLIAQSKIYLRRAAGKAKDPNVIAKLEEMASQLQPLIAGGENG
jgi:hypothetical protein